MDLFLFYLCFQNNNISFNLAVLDFLPRSWDLNSLILKHYLLSKGWSVVDARQVSLMVILVESLYSSFKICFFGSFLVNFCYIMFFIVFSWFLVVFIKPYFETNKKTMKKVWKTIKVPENHQRTTKKANICQKSTNFQQMKEALLFLSSLLLFTRQCYLQNHLTNYLGHFTCKI